MSNELSFKNTERRKDISSNTGALDVIVIFICICGFSASLFLFQKDFFATFHSSLIPPAGTVTVKYNTVQRRHNDRVVWDRLSSQSPVYSGDLVRIARLSGATLNIDDNHIELGENTLIRIQKDSEILQIQFFAGDISISSNSGGSAVRLSVGEQIVEVAPGAAINASSGDDGLVLRVTEGSAQIIYNDEVKEIPAGTMVVQDAHGEAYYPADAVIPPRPLAAGSGTLLPALSLRLPASDSVIVIGDQEDYYFTWTANSDAISYLFQIFPENDLANPVISAQVRDNFYIYSGNSASLSPGRYFWTVIFTNYAGNISGPAEPGSFIAARDRAEPQPLPVNAQSDGLTFTQFELPDIEETLAQLPVEILKEAAQEIPADNITSPLDSMTAQQQELLAILSPDQLSSLSRQQLEQLASMPLGELLQFAAIPAEQLSEMSAQQMREAQNEQRAERVRQEQAAIRAERERQAEIARQAQAQRERQAEIARQAQAQRERQEQMARQAQAEREWQTEVARRERVAQAERVRQEQNEIARQEQERREQNAIEQAQRQEQVVLLDQAEQHEQSTQEQTARRLLRITLLSPQDNTVIEGLAALRQSVNFNWDSEEDIEFARFILSRNSNPVSGRPEIDISNPDKTVIINGLGEGVWYWTVEGRTREGNPVTAESARQIRVLPIPLLEKPADMLPVSGMKIGAQELRQQKDIEFSWSEVEGANAYIVTIYRDSVPRRQQVYQSEPLTELKHTFSDFLTLEDSGAFFWQVEAVFYNSEGMIVQRGNISQNSFDLDIPRPGRVRARETGVLYGR